MQVYPNHNKCCRACMENVVFANGPTVKCYDCDLELEKDQITKN